MQEVNQFEKLAVWRKAHEFVLAIYSATKKFPSIEKYSLIDQVRRSAISIASNIVEGNERISKKEFQQFLSMSKASLAETKYHLLLSRDLGYIRKNEYDELSTKANEVGRMLSGLLNYVRSKI